MSRGNAPYRKLNQSRESFGIARGTAGFSSTSVGRIETGVAVTVTRGAKTAGQWPKASAQGRTSGMFIINNPQGLGVTLLDIDSVQDEIIYGTSGGSWVEAAGSGVDGNTITFWVF